MSHKLGNVIFEHQPIALGKTNTAFLLLTCIEPSPNLALKGASQIGIYMNLDTASKLRHLCLLFASLAFSACGGGGSSGSSSIDMSVTPPSSTNNAPTFTSSNTASVAESVSGPVYTATASDMDGNSLSYSLSDGADAVHFSIDANSGDISFITAPDFENASDSNGDNVYDITLSVADGQGGTDSLSLALSVTDTPNDPVKYRDRFFTEIQEMRDVELAVVDGETLQMDIFQPANDTTQNRPVLIVASGGGFIFQTRQDVEFVAAEFASRGFVTATMDYRVLGRLPFDADELSIAGIRASHDMLAAVRFFRADAESANNFQIRSDAIIVSGVSAGGVMSATLATFDENDVAPTAVIQEFLDANGGVFGVVGNSIGVSSDIQGAVAISGAVLDIGTIDAQSVPIYAAHNEIDPVVPCDTAPEGAAFTGLVVSGSCDFIPALQAAGVIADLFISPSTGHVDFTPEELLQISNEAAALFFTEVISQP